MPAALLTRPLGSDDTAFDLFCGFGGSSQGLHKAGLNVVGAANHNELAIQCHAKNYPGTDHFRADLSNPDAADYVDPQKLPPVTFMWASPSCKNHSQANAKKIYARGPASLFDDGEPFDQVAFANSERSRVTMLCPLRYAAKHKPSFVVVENVVEVTNWGPALPGRKQGDGTTFKWWLKEWEKLGYEHEILYLNSMFFAPCPQSRDRCYIVLWPKGNKRPDLDYRPPAMCTSDACQGAMVEAIQTFKRPTATWMFPRWGKYKTQYIYTCPACTEQVHPVAWPAYTAIDWTNLGPTIAEKRERGDKDLAASTMERIRRGLTKMRGGPSLIIPAKGVWGVDRSSDQPFTTQTTQQDKALVTAGPDNAADPTDTLPVDAGVVPLRTHHEVRTMDGQLPTSVAGNVGMGIIVDTSRSHAPSKYAENRSRSTAAEQLGTVVAQPEHALAFMTAEYGSVAEAKYRSRPISDPLGALTATHSQGLVTEGIVMPVHGNDHERPGQTRARSIDDPMFTVVASQDWGVAHTHHDLPPNALPFLTEMRGGGSHRSGQHAVTEPAKTVSAGGFHHGLTSPALFQAQNGGPTDTTARHAGEPLPTVVSKGTTAMYVLPWLEQYQTDPAGVTEQLATLMTHARHALLSAQAVEWAPVTDDELEQVRFRMLQPDPELRLAMAFGRDYHLIGNKTQMVAGLGNAVTPPVAEFITARCMATLAA